MNDPQLDTVLAGALMGAHRSVAVPAAELGQGLAAQPQTRLEALLETDFRDAVFLGTCLPELDEVGLSLSVLEANPRVLKVSSVQGDELQVLGGSGLAFLAPEEPGTAYLELRGSRRALLQVTNRCGVLLEGDGLELTQLFLPLVEEESEPIVSEVQARSSGDAWLAARVAERLGQGDAIAHACAVGMAKRLAQQEGARALAERVLAGEPIEALSWPHRWMRGLSGAQLRMIERIATERAAALCKQLAAIQAGATSSAEEHAARERDELEGVRVMLRELRRGQRLEARLAEADRTGQRLRELRKIKRLDDSEQARRISLLDPAAWWIDGEAPGA